LYFGRSKWPSPLNWTELNWRHQTIWRMHEMLLVPYFKALWAYGEAPYGCLEAGVYLLCCKLKPDHFSWVWVWGALNATNILHLTTSALTIEDSYVLCNTRELYILKEYHSCYCVVWTYWYCLMHGKLQWSVTKERQTMPPRWRPVNCQISFTRCQQIFGIHGRQARLLVMLSQSPFPQLGMQVPTERTSTWKQAHHTRELIQRETLY